MSAAAGLGSSTLTRAVRWTDARSLRWAVLLLCATLSLGTYLGLLFIVPNLATAEPSFAEQVIPAAALLRAGALLALGDALDPAERVQVHAAAVVPYLLLICCLFGTYGLALWSVAGQRSRTLAATALVAGALFLGVQLLSPALLSGDVYSYIIYGRIFAHYGANPYVQVPAQYPDDPFAPLVYWQFVPSFYGPLWTLLSAGLALVGGEAVGFTVLLFRAIAVAAAIASAGLIWACLARSAPNRAAQGVVLFLWNPLVVLESGLSAHNDIVMVALLLLAVWLFARRRPTLALVALALSALVKFITLLLLPPLLLLAVRQVPNRRALARWLASATVAVGLVVAAVLLGARAGPEALAVGTLGTSVDRYHNSLHELALNGLRLWLGEDPVVVATPLQFEPWWVATHRATDLRAGLEPSAARLASIPQWTPCLVLAPQRGAWLRVYDTASGLIGYIRAEDAGPIVRPTDQADAAVVQLERGPSGTAATQLAHAWLRAVAWTLFGAVWIWAVLRARQLATLLESAVAMLLAFIWLAANWVWPWYVLWPLAVASLVPASGVAWTAVALSATVLSLYAAHGFQDSSLGWIYTYRSIPAFLLPLLLVLAGRVLLGLGRGLKLTPSAAWGRLIAPRARAADARPGPPSGSPAQPLTL